MNEPLSNSATVESFERLKAVVPQFDRCVPAFETLALPDKTLLHAGPPLRAGAVSAPLINSAAAAAVFEGWAKDDAEARAAIGADAIRLAPAQDYGVVTPLAFVVSPSMWLLRVSDAAGKASPRYTPINDGPPPAALRFGARQQGQDERLALIARAAPGLRDALQQPVAVLPVMRAGLDGGDDLHGRVSVANAALTVILAPRLTGDAAAYVALANQFVLNVVMAACAVMIGAGAGVPDSRMVIAAGGNGADFGWQRANTPGVWRARHALAPVGPHFPQAATRRFLPAIGDSAVIDACGFGAAALRHAPEMMAALKGHVPDGYFTEAASAPFIGPHPAFPPDLKFGLDLGRETPLRGVMLAALDADGEAGLAGRGVAPWPQG